MEIKIQRIRVKYSYRPPLSAALEDHYYTCSIEYLGPRSPKGPYGPEHTKAKDGDFNKEREKRKW